MKEEKFWKEWNNLTKKEQELIDKWIKKLEKLGYTYDQMISIFKRAQQIHDLKENKNEKLPTKSR